MDVTPAGGPSSAGPPIVASSPPVPALTPDENSVPELLRALRRVPMELRRFALSARQARATHGIDQQLLDTLVAEGLPSVGAPGKRLFDDYDLANISLHMGRTSVQRMAIRSWSSSLQFTSQRSTTCYRLSYRPACPVPGHSGPCRFHLLTPGGARTTVTGAGGDHLVTFQGDLRGEWPALGPAALDLLGRYADLRFFILPEAIRWDLDFLRRTRTADCGGAAAALVDEGARCGVAVRFAFGLLVARPYATAHCWAEFQVDDVWVPQDQLLVGMMTRWGNLPTQQWPLGRSPGAILLRLTDRFTKIASHDGLWSGLSAPTEYLSRPDHDQG